MKKVLIDSSVWVSLFAQDVNYKQSLVIIEELMDKNVIIVLPAVVYVEVINTLVRLKQSGEKINVVKQTLFNKKKIPDIIIAQTNQKKKGDSRIFVKLIAILKTLKCSYI